ncbi:MAG: ATPase, T2SS/T4P/T4SS family [Campylobacterota bacterium]|nr:ATPase, T2SS/T4P/T4SS family [Campylobacterota bacterium]
MEQKKLPLGKLLQNFGYISEEHIQVALNVQKANRKFLGQILQELDFVTPTEIAIAIAKQYGYEYIDLDMVPISDEALELIPFELAQSKTILPVDIKDNKLIVAMENVNDMDAVDSISRMSPYPLELVVADERKIRRMIEVKYYQLLNPIEQQIQDKVTQFLDDEEVDIIELVELIINKAIKDSTTDIHITPDSEVIYLFFRIDGVLNIAYTLPKKALQPIVSRIKILSKMDISESRLPQDGSFSHNFVGSRFDLRVSTIPTNNGENIVMRLLSSDTSAFNLESGGFEQEEIDQLKRLFNKPYGIVLVTGPTGSGKTTTLYTLLRHINFIQKNIMTIEDPIEYRFSFIRQTEVNEKAGYTFNAALRTFMRQDPDAMLVGEMRDEETAELAVRAAITGHLVLSTLHTNDAVGAVPRLLDLGIKDYLLSSSVLAVLAQRLLRRLCPLCKESITMTREEIVSQEFADHWLEDGQNSFELYKEVGCEHCNNTGYKGREAVIEILEFTDIVKDMINKGSAPLAIFEEAQREGMRSLKQNALLKAFKGKTSINEIQRVLV